MACKLCGPKLSLCGLVLSVWGIIQLTLMGVFYHIRAVALLEDLPLEEGGHHGIEGFLAQVEAGYTQHQYLDLLKMSFLFGCGLCCMMLSIWAVLQLLIMGIFFKMEVLAFIEEAEPDHHGYDDYDDFIKKTKENYALIAVNCWIATAIYVLFIGLSYFCIRKAKANDLINAERMKDDELFCSEKDKKGNK